MSTKKAKKQVNAYAYKTVSKNKTLRIKRMLWYSSSQRRVEKKIEY